jgi:hypothetical protein
MLAPHVVGPGHEGPQRRAAEDILVLAPAEKIGQVRVAAGKLLDLELAPHGRKPRPEIRVERTRVEELVASDGLGVAGVHASGARRRWLSLASASASRFPR